MSGSPVSTQFVLLRDFDIAYDMLASKAIDIEYELRELVLEPMVAALRESVDRLTQYSATEIRSLTAENVDSRYFVVTMDGGTYFERHDFSFEITRAAYRLADAAEGPHVRLPRGPQRPQLLGQGMRLRDRYEAEGSGRPILLCDDGIGTGKSIETIANILSQLNVDLSRITVLLNPAQVDRVQDAPVHTILPVQGSFLWLSERDLYWGLPRSGLSFTRPHEFAPVFGVPYTVTPEMVTARIGLHGNAALEFRSRCLELNIRFWEFLEQKSGRALTLSDCTRLAYFGELVGDDMRVVDLIASALDGTFIFPVHERREAR